eukprot:3652185-Amphidinium_carterae.1
MASCLWHLEHIRLNNKPKGPFAFPLVAHGRGTSRSHAVVSTGGRPMAPSNITRPMTGSIAFST